MNKKFLIGILLFFILISTLFSVSTAVGLWQPGVEITDFDAPDYQKAGDSFTVNVTVRNDRLLPVRTTIQINLLDGMLNCIRKNIDTKNYVQNFKAKQSKTIEIECKIREGDIDWYKEKYNVEAVLFRNFSLLGWGRQLDSAVNGIHIKSKLTEKDKVKIERVNVNESLKKGDEYNKFVVKVYVKNDGCYDFDAWVRIDLIEKPSAIPELEEYIDLKALVAVRKEIGGGRNNLENINPGCEYNFSIPCELRFTEVIKEQFNIEAVLFVDIDGNEYQVDKSTLYGIYHKQPICRDEGCWFLWGMIFGGIAGIVLIVILIYRRIRYPYYGVRKYK